jgi:hypothetical protein
MSYKSFIPQIWVAKLLPILRNNLNFQTITNRDYEGEIKAGGDSVVINQMSAPTVGTYTNASGVTFEDLATVEQTLLIDQQKYFAFDVNDIDKAQAKDGGALMAKGISEGGYALQEVVDIAIASKYGDAGIKNGSGGGALGTTSTPLEITVDGGGTSVKVSDWLGRVARRATEGKMPDNLPKSLIVPPWLHQKMVSDKLLNPRTVTNDGTYVTGEVQQAYGLNISVSNNVQTVSTRYQVLCGNRNSITIADQITHVEPGRRESYFRDFIKALYVYGIKTVRADQLLLSQVYEGTEGQ